MSIFSDAFGFAVPVSDLSPIQQMRAKVRSGETVQYRCFVISLEATGYATYSYAHESYDGPDGNFPCGTSDSFEDIIEAIDLWIAEQE